MTGETIPLKYKLQPHYHLVANVKLSDLPEKPRHIWKTIAVPKPDAKSPPKDKEPIILNATYIPQRSQSAPQARKSTKNKQLTAPKETHTEPLQHYLSQQLHNLKQQIQQFQQPIQHRGNPCTETWRTYPPRTCFNCGKPGQLARDCRSNKARFNQYQQNRQNPPFNKNQNFNQKPQYRYSNTHIQIP